MSDERAFGVCAFGSFVCHRDFPDAIDACTEMWGTPCACAVTFPRPAAAPEEYGVATTLTSCSWYRATYPARVECYGADWAIL